MNERLIRCHLIASVLAADGFMKAEEREFLRAIMADAGLDEEEQRQVIEFEGHDKALDAAKALDIETRQRLADEVVEAALKDGKLSPRELEIAQSLAAVLTAG